MTLVRKKQNERIPAFFDSYLLKNLMEWPEARTYKTDSRPAVNISENDKQFELELAAPGLRKEDFSVKIDKNVLTISSAREAKQEDKQEAPVYTVREFSYQSFERSFSLPEKLIDEEKIEASYKDGILRLLLPKQEEKKPKVKQIRIS